MKGSHARNGPSSENYLSWNKGTQAEVLRVELADGSFWLFPYGQLGAVKFERNGGDDLLNVRFTRHEVQITGKHLRPLGLAFQKLGVDWVRELPARFGATADGDRTYVAGIKVSEIQQGQ